MSFWLVLVGQEKASLALTWLVDVGWISVGAQVFPGLKALLHLEMLFPCFGLGGKMFFFFAVALALAVMVMCWHSPWWYLGWVVTDAAK